MTFPIESKVSRESDNRLGVMINSTLSEPGAFYAYMGLSAAHKAIVSGKLSDVPASDGKERVLNEPDFYIMKAKGIKEINKKLQDPEQALSDAAFDIVVGLISSKVRDVSFCDL